VAGPTVIGIDAREIEGPRVDSQMGSAGRSRYARELVRRLPELAPDIRFVLYGRTENADGLPGNAEWRCVRGSDLAWHFRTARLARAECSVYFSAMSYLTPQLLSRYVQTVFDTVSFDNGLGPQARRSAWNERITMRRAVKRATRILAISQSTASDVAELVPEVTAKVDVTPLAADERFRADRPPSELAEIRERFGLPGTFVLSTGTLAPRKNFLRLVRAYAALPAALRETTPLVLAGRRGWDDEPIFAVIDSLPAGQIRHLDFVQDDELPTLYAASTVFCFPSLYEGFGLTILEAMQSGVPVLTSNVSSLPEVGGQAAVYVDPRDEGELSAALEQLLTDAAMREALAAAGPERAKEFSWEKTAALTLDALLRSL
jgi:glycosyltransferase involved in cell wall biosynthesis